MHIRLPVSARLPGFKTDIRQTLDFRYLSPQQFTRVHNAAAAGYVTGRGYVAEALEHLARANGLMGPVVAASCGFLAYVSHYLFCYPIGHTKHVVDDLMALSDVRQKFLTAQDPTTWARRHVGESVHKDNTLKLVGWHGEKLNVLRREVLPRMNAIPAFVENNKRLAEAVSTRPMLTIYSQTL